MNDSGDQSSPNRGTMITARAKRSVGSRALGKCAATLMLRVCWLLLAPGWPGPVFGDVPKPNDAPKPLAPVEAEKSFHPPPGFRMQLVASEPLISEPTGVCWDEHGTLYVCELHGYNLEGQLEIEEMNKAGTLDQKVQRVQAAERFKKAAATGTYGVVKRLLDIDGDGVMDRVQVLASNLPPAYGICPARGGLIVAGQAQIVFLADRDGDGVAEVRETLFTGWKSGALERGINSPQWGPDGWIYFGRGWGAEQITGPHLKTPVHLPNTDFRIRADGSAIEPVGAGTHTIGLAFTPEGDRFFTTTWKHALYAVPIPWRDLERNPDAAAPSLEADASEYTRVFPVAPVHPWKQARSSLPGWKELYGGYGIAESAASGYFTSCCSPLVYQSAAFPPQYQGNLLVCEPAQNLIHRSLVERDGPALRVRRAPGEEKSEFLASTDAWFRPVSLVHAPDGAVLIVDMYREIIEDYSAVPRFMQQQYGLSGGVRHGRLWRLGFADDGSDPARRQSIPGVDMAALSDAALVQELDSANYWRRQTAERLLRERQGENAPGLRQRQGTLAEVVSLLRPRLPIASIEKRTEPNQPGREQRVIELLRRHDSELRTNEVAARQIAQCVSGVIDSRVLLQLALSLGYSDVSEAWTALVSLARQHGQVRWMSAALMTGLHERAGRMLVALLPDPGQGVDMLEPLSASIAARGNAEELAEALVAVKGTKSAALRAACLKGLKALRSTQPLPELAVAALDELLRDDDAAVRGLAMAVAGKVNRADRAVLQRLSQQAAEDAANPGLSTEQRLAAVALVASSEDPASAERLLAGWAGGTPNVRAAILEGLMARGNRLNTLVSALEDNRLPASALSMGQRTRLLERADSHLRPRLEEVFARSRRPDLEGTYQRFVEALPGPRDVQEGARLFQQLCASCHRVGEIGTAVGPNLTQAFQRAEETLVRDILAPSEMIASGYESYTINSKADEEFSGVLVSDSATSITLRMAGGIEQTILRKDVAGMRSSSVSLMPDGFGETLTPQGCASLLAWLRVALAVEVNGTVGHPTGPMRR